MFNMSLSGNLETGEGHITAGSQNKIKQLTFDNSLLAADLLKDWIYDLQQLYDEALLEMRKDFDGTKDKQ